ARPSRKASRPPYQSTPACRKRRSLFPGSPGAAHRSRPAPTPSPCSRPPRADATRHAASASGWAGGTSARSISTGHRRSYPGYTLSSRSAPRAPWSCATSGRPTVRSSTTSPSRSRSPFGWETASPWAGGGPSCWSRDAGRRPAEDSARAETQRLRQELAAARAAAAPATQVESLRTQLRAAETRTAELRAALDRAQAALSTQLAAGEARRVAAQADLQRMRDELAAAERRAPSQETIDSLKRAVTAAERQTQNLDAKMRAIRASDFATIAQ